jgi:hypothetical protein
MDLELLRKKGRLTQPQPVLLKELLLTRTSEKRISSIRDAIGDHSDAQ